MTVSVHGLPAKTGFDLFVIQTPNKPFGVAWYQTELQTDSHGNGTVTVRGIFNVETFGRDPRKPDGARCNAPVPPGPVVQQPGQAVRSPL